MQEYSPNESQYSKQQIYEYNHRKLKKQKQTSYLIPFRSCRRLFLKIGHYTFLSPLPHRGLGATYTVHLRITGKLIVGFLFMVIELFR